MSKYVRKGIRKPTFFYVYKPALGMSKEKCNSIFAQVDTCGSNTQELMVEMSWKMMMSVVSKPKKVLSVI